MCSCGLDYLACVNLIHEAKKTIVERLNLNLRKYAYFPDGLLKAINGKMKKEEFGDGAIILNKGRMNDRCYFILSGVIKIVDEENNETVILYILAEDDFVIAPDSFLLYRPTKYKIIAVGPVKVVSATLGELLEISKEFLILPININIIQAHYRNEKEQEVSLYSTLSAQEKYDHFKKAKEHIIGRLCDEDIWRYLNMSEKTYYKCKNGWHKGKEGHKQ